MKKILSASLFAFLSAGAAFAADAPVASPRGGALSAFFPLIIFVVIFYFFILRPQKKRQKTHDNLVNTLQRGDRVITAGGFFGIVREVKDDSIIIEIAEGIVARVMKSSISTKVKPEAPKAAPKAEEPVKAAEPAKPEEAPAAEDKR